MSDKMDDSERIKKDMELFAKNIKGIESIKLHESEYKIMEMAKRYSKDTEYYLKKKDYLTAFGCISYAHGLIDALRLIYGIL